MTLQTYFDRYLPPLEAEMRSALLTDDERHADLFGMLRYHLGWVDESFEPRQTWTGKRVRPVLCLLTCEACEGDWEQALPAASALELMHNFTLIHDDIEDNDDTRRGRPTVWRLWGRAQAINAGDTLFALSQLALLRLIGRDAPAETLISALRLFNRTCVAITEGQYLDIGFERRDDVSVDEYLAMIERKTAALVACSCEMGALIAEAPISRRESVRAFGRHLGLAFQIRDDILGIWGKSEVTGKPVGSDIIRRKKSLPILHGLACDEGLRRLFAQEAFFTPDDVAQATEMLQASGSRAYTESLEKAHYDRALSALEKADVHGAAAQGLSDLARKLLNRKM